MFGLPSFHKTLEKSLPKSYGDLKYDQEVTCIIDDVPVKGKVAEVNNEQGVILVNFPENKLGISRKTFHIKDGKRLGDNEDGLVLK